jgi:type I restriction enzyme R subunit
MSAHAYTEDQLVEQPASGLFAALGWSSIRNATKSIS